MNHWTIVPALLPALTAAFLILAVRHQLESQRIVSIVATILLLIVNIGLLAQSADGVTRTYQLGGWTSPFGIVLVLDRLSATLLVLTNVLALAVITFSSAGQDEQGQLFHPLFQFLLLGLNGAFLTGDLFNLFVFFEVMLIASYGLMLHGGGPKRLKAGFQYVAINLFASTLFLIGIGLVYGATGTLNMAHLAFTVPVVPEADQGILLAGMLLLYVVFALKAALVPLHWWLPATYSATTAAAAGVFMVMTKVGAYALLRVHGLVFGAADGPGALVTDPFILPMAAITVVVGALGVLASRTLKGLAAFSVVTSMGTLMIGLGLYNTVGVAAALYYLVHSTLAGAALFLIAGLVGQKRGAMADALKPAPAPRAELALGGLYLLAAIAMVGLPPLSGFLGKIMLLDAARTAVNWPWLWALILGSSLVLTLGFLRAGMILFWQSTPPQADSTPAAPVPLVLPVIAIVLLLSLVSVWTFAGGVAADWLEAAAIQTLDRDGYIEALMGNAPDLRGEEVRAQNSLVESP